MNAMNRNTNITNTNTNIHTTATAPRPEVVIDMVVQAMEALKQEQALRQAAEAKLAAQQGKVLFADAFAAGSDSMLVGDLANLLKQNGVETGQSRLFAWMRENGYLYRQPCGQNLPTQRSLELGVMEMKHTAMLQAGGHVRMNKTPKITPKGVQYFFDKIMAQKDTINQKQATKKQACKSTDTAPNADARPRDAGVTDAQQVVV